MLDIIRQIRANVPLRVIAFSHDTSVGEIERTYSRFLGNAADDLTRASLLADMVPVGGDKVVPMR